MFDLLLKQPELSQVEAKNLELSLPRGWQQAAPGAFPESWHWNRSRTLNTSPRWLACRRFQCSGSLAPPPETSAKLSPEETKAAVGVLLAFPLLYLPAEILCEYGMS